MAAGRGPRAWRAGPDRRHPRDRTAGRNAMTLFFRQLGVWEAPDPQAAMPVLRALAHGMIDAYLPAPGAGRDEGFHRGVSELLEEWAHDAAPALPAVRIIDQQQSARAHELRDVLARSSIPYVFHAAGSADVREAIGGQAGS